MVAGVSLLAAGILVDRSVAGRATRETTERLHALAREARMLAADGDERAGGAAERAVRIGRAIGVRATLIDREGRAIGDSLLEAEALASLGSLSNRPEVREAWRRSVGESIRRGAADREPTLYIAVQIDPDEAERGLIRLSTSLAPVDKARQAARPPLYVAALILIPAAALAGQVVGSGIARRLSGISRVLDRIGAGQTESHAAPAGEQDLIELARSVNRMVDAIADRNAPLARQRNQLRMVLDGMVEGVLLIDPAGRIVLSNEAFRSIFDVQGATEGRRPLEAARVPALQGAVEDALRAPGPILREITVGGSQDKVIRASLAAVREAGNPAGVVAVFHDVTELKSLEQVRRDFVANVSHELRTPLTAIRGYAETLRDGGLEDAKMAGDAVEVIHRHSERLRALIEDLLDLSAIEQGKASLRIAPVPIDEVVEQAVAVVRPSSREKRHGVEIALAPGRPSALADRDRLAQVLINLLDNAVKFTPEGGQIGITSTLGEMGIVISIRDTGVGIPPDEVGRIFERFYRVDRSRNRQEGGTGLGLAIAKHLVQAMGGEIRIESVEGKGTTFHVGLPAA